MIINAFFVFIVLCRGLELQRCVLPLLDHKLSRGPLNARHKYLPERLMRQCARLIYLLPLKLCCNEFSDVESLLTLISHLERS